MQEFIRKRHTNPTDSSTSDDDFECEESFYEEESSSDDVEVIEKVNDMSEVNKDANADNEMADFSYSDDEDNCPIYDDFIIEDDDNQFILGDYNWKERDLFWIVKQFEKIY